VPLQRSFPGLRNALALGISDLFLLVRKRKKKIKNKEDGEYSISVLALLKRSFSLFIDSVELFEWNFMTPSTRSVGVENK